MSSYDLTVTNSTREEIKELLKDVCAQRRKYNEYQIIQDVIYECIKEENCMFSLELQAKIFDILMANNIQSYLELGSNSSCSLLGLNLNITNLTYEENENLKDAVQLKLTQKRRELFKDLRDLGLTIEENNSLLVEGLNLNVQEKVLIDLKRQLNEKQQLHLELLQELRDILEEIINLKVKTLAETTDEKIRTDQIQAELFCVKAKCLNAQLKIKIFSETSFSLNAYKEVLKDVMEQQKDCREEIEKLKELQEKYKQVSCKQYEEILRNYIKYKASIDKKTVI